MSTIKKDSLWIFKPHRTVLINNKTTKQHYLFFYYIYGLLPLPDVQAVADVAAPGHRDLVVGFHLVLGCALCRAVTGIEAGRLRLELAALEAFALEAGRCL